MRLIAYAAMALTLFFSQPQDYPRDPLKDAQKKAEREAAERNYKEMKDAAAEMAALSKQLSDEIEDGGQHVISARVFDKLEKIEKLAKKVRDRAKGNNAAVPKFP